MNKRALKEFAVYARNELRRQIGLRAHTFGITPEGSLPGLTEGTDYIEVNGKKYPKKLKQAFNQLFTETEQKGYDQLLEEAAYTWFNRLIALRYMEVHRYLPSRIRVLSSEIKGKIDPDILTEYRYADLPVNEEEIAELLQQGKRDEAFKNLLIVQCNALNDIMPFLFEKLEDYTELLLPDNLLHADSFINRLVNDLEEEDFAHVEVIGWLYQYYISEKKDEVFAGLKKNKKITKENIPAATQLFTPHWIVRYMVENSLGQMWLESHENSNIRKQMKYYIEPEVQETEVKSELDKLKVPNLSPEEITIMDPACGSGHILVYAFDLLYSIYEERGYASKDIPRLILEKNLYGMDIDDRAVQLASFALIMKARSVSKKIFGSKVQLNIISIQEDDTSLNKVLQTIGNNNEEYNSLTSLIENFRGAKSLGSIVTPENLNLNKYIMKINEIEEQEYSLEKLQLQKGLERLKRILKQSQLLTLQYDVVITNPPYMGGQNMNEKLSKYVKHHYKESKADLFSVFMERCIKLTKKNGYHGAITQQSWMFLTSYENLRKKMICSYTINSMIHLGRNAFEDISGEVVQSTSYVLRNVPSRKHKAKYYRLVDIYNTYEKERQFLYKNNEYIIVQEKFLSIPGYPFSYWASTKVQDIFKKYKNIGYYAKAKQGLTTSNNALFVREWFEVNYTHIGFGLPSRELASKSSFKWFPYLKGGTYRKWSGNEQHVVDWKHDGLNIHKYNNIPLTYKGAPVRNKNYYFNEGITWSAITSSSNLSLRYVPEGFIFSNAGMSIFGEREKLVLLIGILNSKVAKFLIKHISATLNFNAGDIAKIPVNNSVTYNELKDIIFNNIAISKKDWNYFELSWEYKLHPLLIFNNNMGNQTLSASFYEWKKHTESQFDRLKRNEEQLNRLFIEAYDLEDTLTPSIENNEIAIRIANREREVKSFLSYAVGLIMGRYSIDKEGLVYAGGEWDASKYKTFQPDQNGIIPLTSEAYFEDDIILRLEELLKVIYGEKTLQENLYWLAESLTMKANETPIERLRRYFFDEFYKDHCKTYQKRPIYWMAESGKKKGFRALFYLHRYTPETLATMRFSYVQNLQEKLRQEEKRLESVLTNPDLSSTERKRTEKQLQTIRAQQEELVEFDKVLAEYANQRIELDLDDGVVENYKKLGKVVAPIK
jgi:type II restriction/modification system DNA methylase subunit YeeA